MEKGQNADNGVIYEKHPAGRITMVKKPLTTKTVASLQHEEAKRKNIPTAEYQSVLEKEQQNPKRVR